MARGQLPSHAGAQTEGRGQVMKDALWLTSLVLFCTSPAWAQENPQDGGKAVTREEYEKLKKDLEALKARQTDPKVEKSGVQDLQEQMDELEKELKAVKEKANGARPGETKFLVTGYGFAGFTLREREPSTFSAGVSPIFLWRPADRIFFEAEIELELEDTETELKLEYADLNYVLTDELTIRAGRFLAPFGTFADRLHPKWINKLPDNPFAFDEAGGISPFSVLGVEARGAVALGGTKITYAAYLANSLRLITDDPADAGKLADDKFSDDVRRKIVGGRLGFYPFPELEVGYSLLFGRVGPSGTEFSDVDAFLQAVDVTYVREADLIQGTVTILGQWAWSRVDRTTYDSTGALLFGPITFENRRQGGYLQCAYRPSKLDWEWIRNCELIVRYDLLNNPREALDNVDLRRWTLGLDYWITPALVAKVAYEWEERKNPAGTNEHVNAFLAQFALGF